MKNNQAPWPRQAIRDLCRQVTSGGTPSRARPDYYVQSGVPWVKTQELRDRVIRDTLEHISRDALKASAAKVLPEGTVLVAMYGATAGQLGLLGRPMTCNQACCALIPDPGRCDGRYLFYSLLYERQRLRSLASGAAQQNLNVGTIGRLEIAVPPLDQQKRVVAILGGLDEQLDLNRRTSDTIQALVDAKFAADLSSGRDTVTLGEIANITMGQSPPGSTYNSDEVGLPFYQGSSDFRSRFPARRIYCTAPTRVAQAGDVLVSVRAPVGALNLADVECGIGRGVAAISERAGLKSYLYYLMRATRGGWDQFNAVGTVFGAVTKDGANGFPVPRHSETEKATFDDWARPFDELIAANTRENRLLAELRDGLLPELISGRMTVN